MKIMRYIARLKYTDRQEFEADFTAKNLLVEHDGELVKSNKVTAIVELGTLYEQTGTDENSEPIMTSLNGYHVDVELTEPISFGDKIIAPNNPRHGQKWAEGATILTE